MNIDLPPSSASSDPAVARPGSMRDRLTLTLPLEQGQVDANHELMSGSVSTSTASAPSDGSLRTAIAPVEDMVLTITF